MCGLYIADFKIHLVAYREISLVILSQLTFQVHAKAPFEVIAVHTNMPGLTTEPPFKHIAIKELHPTFGAEISGIDFSKPVDDYVFQEVLAAITKVSIQFQRHKFSMTIHSQHAEGIPNANIICNIYSMASVSSAKLV